MLTPALDRTEDYLRSQRLRGWDPYDTLCSPLFGLPVLRSNRLLRFGAQQVGKRLPVNARSALKVPKHLNPVSVGLFVQGLAYRAQADPSATADRRAEARHWVAVLGDLVTSGWSGACWGYPFDWEARHASLPAGTPTVVATGMVTNSLAAADAVFDLPEARELLIDASRFVTDDLHRTDGPGESFCWSYSPLDHQVVLNATAKGSRLLAQASAMGASDPKRLLDLARGSARFVVHHQTDGGAWPYAIGDTRRWADNFHTGYVLECLRAYQIASSDSGVGAAIARGWSYYRRRFFTTDLVPKYYDDGIWPIDATSCAQAIITLATFGDVAAATSAAAASVATLGLADGSFAYQRRRRSTVRIPYLRWSTAWMFCALARLAAACSDAAGVSSER